MMGRYRRFLQWLVVLGLLAGMLGVAGPSVADIMVPTELPLQSFGEILVDDSSDRIFISGGINDDRVLVMDLDARITRTITGLPGASGMAISPDGTILWVAAENDDAVVGLSTTSFAEVDRVNLPGMCPRFVAVTGTKMAIGPTCYIMVTVDLAGDRTPVQIHQDLLLTPLLSTTGLAQGLVVAAETATSSSDVYLLDISGPAPAVVAERLRVGGTARDISLSPDGSTVLIASGDGQGIYALNSADLTDTTAPPVVGPAAAVAWSQDGTKWVVANGLEPDIHLYPWGQSVAAWTFDSALGARRQGIAMSPDNTSIYLVTYTEEFGPPALQVLTVGVNPGSISGSVRGYGGSLLDQPHVDLLDADGGYLFTTDVATSGSGAGTYTIENLEPDTYHAVFWNGDDQFFYDYFPEWFRAIPVLRSSQATPIVVGNGEDVTGVDAELRWLYADMFGHVFENDIWWLGNTGITKGCNPPNNYFFCPNDVVTRGQMAAFMVRALSLTDRGTTDFVDDDGSVFEESIEKLAAAGITKGCNPPTNDHFCPNDPVTRGQMAAFMKRALSS